MEQEIWHFSSNPNEFSGIYFPDKLQRKEVRALIKKYINNHLPVGKSWGDYFVLRDVPLIDGAFTTFSGAIPVVTEFGMKKLKPLLNDSVEFLPLKSENESFYLVNVLKTVNALDIEKSNARVYYKSDDKKEIETIGVLPYNTRFLQNHSLYQNVYVFKIPFLPKSVFYTKPFKDFCIDQGLLGLDFRSHRLREKF